MLPRPYDTKPLLWEGVGAAKDAGVEAPAAGGALRFLLLITTVDELLLLLLLLLLSFNVAIAPSGDATAGSGKVVGDVLVESIFKLELLLLLLLLL